MVITGQLTRHDDTKALVLFSYEVFDRDFYVIKLNICGGYRCSSVLHFHIISTLHQWQHVPLACTPEFGIFLHVTPFAFRGITNAETPFAPLPPVRTAAIQ
jgi:hypothetical protein